MKRLRVYLSSTYEDLKEYREAVFAALEKGGLEVARMEAYTAADERPLDLCLRDVAQSEIYVGVYGWRYGYEPPAEHGNPEGKSITELEYRQAERAGLRKLLFFVHPDTRAGWPERFNDEATGAGDRGEKLKRFRKEAGTEKTASFFRRPEELAILVLAAIMRSGLSGRAYNVPPRPAGFVPRPALATAIVSSIVGGKDGTAGIHTLIQGAGGFGKTTLAIDACHHLEVVNAFPDGLLWTSLGETPSLGMILSDLHVLATGGSPPVAGDEQIALALAKALDGRRCLMVLDDLWRPDDLAPFLSLNGPRLLVTTRVRTLIEQAGQTGWSEVPVDEMGVSEAAAVLGRGLTLDASTTPVLEGLAERLGCWPLLLELVNARLLEEKKRRASLSECIDAVTAVFDRKGVLGFDRRDSKARNTAVARSIDAGLEVAESSSPGLARKAAETSVFAENVAIPTVVLADLWATDRWDLEEEVLRPLDNLSILGWDRQAGTVRLHMMVDRALDARLEHEAGAAAAVHRRLLDAWGDPHRLPHDYAWRWFGWHCIQANDATRLQRLLLDFDWLRAKLEATDINALLGEFDYVPDDPQTALIEDALRLSAHMLARDKPHLRSQLLARLPQQEGAFRDQVLQWALAIRTPWLRPLQPTLTQPGGALVRTLSGHTDGVMAVALTADGKRAVSASEDRTLKVWDLLRGEALRTLVGHTNQVSSVALTPDGKRVVSASYDGTLKIWDLERGDVLRTLDADGSGASVVVLTPDGTRAVSAGGDHTLKVWDLERGELLHTLTGHTAEIWSAALTPDGSRVWSGGGDATVRVWDLESGELLRTLEGHTGDVYAVAISRDGRRAVTGSTDETVNIWDVERGELLRTLEAHWNAVRTVALMPDGTRILSGGDDDALKMWDLEHGALLRTFKGHAGRVGGVAVTRDGKRAVTGGDDDALKVWDLERAASPRSSDEDTVAARAMALTPDGQGVISVSSKGVIQIWDLERAVPVRAFESRADEIATMAQTPDGTRVVLGSFNRTLTICDLGRGEVLRTLTGHTIDAVAITPDGQQVVSARYDGTLMVWDLASGELLRTLEGHTRGVQTVLFTRDGKRAVSTNWGELNVWNLDTGELLLSFNAGPHLSVADTINGPRVLSRLYGQLVVLDLNHPDQVRALEGHEGIIGAVALTTDGTRAASAAGATLKIWNLERDEVLLTLEGHEDDVTAVALTPDGRRAVSASKDWTVAVWDLEAGKLLAAFGADSTIRTAVFAPDGRTVVALDEGGRVHFLRVENEGAWPQVASC